MSSAPVYGRSFLQGVEEFESDAASGPSANTDPSVGSASPKQRTQGTQQLHNRASMADVRKLITGRNAALQGNTPSASTPHLVNSLTKPLTTSSLSRAQKSPQPLPMSPLSAGSGDSSNASLPRRDLDFETLLRSNETKKMSSTPDHLKDLEIRKMSMDQPRAKMQAKAAAGFEDDSALLSLLRSSRNPAAGPARAAEASADATHEPLGSKPGKARSTHWIEFLNSTSPEDIHREALPTPPLSNRSSQESGALPKDKTGSSTPVRGDHPIHGSTTEPRVSTSLPRPPGSPTPGRPGSANSSEAGSPRRTRTLSNSDVMSAIAKNVLARAGSDQAPSVSSAPAAAFPTPPPLNSRYITPSTSTQTTVTAAPITDGKKSNGNKGRRSAALRLFTTLHLRGPKTSTTTSASTPALVSQTRGVSPQLTRPASVHRLVVGGRAQGLVSPTSPLKELRSITSEGGPEAEEPAKIGIATTSLVDAVHRLVVLDPAFANLDELMKDATIVDEPVPLEPSSIADTATSSSKITQESAQEHQADDNTAASSSVDSSAVEMRSQSTQTIHSVLVAETEFVFDEVDGHHEEDVEHDAGNGHVVNSPGEFVDAHVMCMTCGTPAFMVDGDGEVNGPVNVSVAVPTATTNEMEKAVNDRDHIIKALQHRAAALENALRVACDTSAAVLSATKAKQTVSAATNTDAIVNASKFSQSGPPSPDNTPPRSLAVSTIEGVRNVPFVPPPAAPSTPTEGMTSPVAPVRDISLPRDQDSRTASIAAIAPVPSVSSARTGSAVSTMTSTGSAPSSQPVPPPKMSTRARFVAAVPAAKTVTLTPLPSSVISDPSTASIIRSPTREVHVTTGFPSSNDAAPKSEARKVTPAPILTRPSAAATASTTIKPALPTPSPQPTSTASSTLLSPSALKTDDIFGPNPSSSSLGLGLDIDRALPRINDGAASSLFDSSSLADELDKIFGV